MFRAASLVCFLLVSCGSPKPPPKAPVPAAMTLPEDEMTAIRGVLEQYRQAYEVASAEAVAPLYSHGLDVSLVYQGKIYRGWTAVKSFLAARLSGASSVRMSMKDPAIYVLGPNSAVISADRQSSIGNDAVTVSERGSLTLVLQKRKGQWLVVAEHFSYLSGR